MRKITKSLLTLALLVLAVGSANAAKLNADLSKLATIGGTNATWDGATNTITWTDKSNNMVTNFDFAAGNYSSWKNIVVKVASLDNASFVRIQIRANGKEKTKPFNGTGTISVSLADFGFSSGDLNSVEWIRMLGSNWDDPHTINSTTPASAVIEEVYFEGPDILSLKERIVAPVGTTDVKDLTGTNTSWATSVTYPKEFNVQGNFFGNNDGSAESNHVNIDGYDYICFYVTHAPANSAGLRIWIWNGEAGGAGSVVTLYAYPIADYATATYTTPAKINAGVGTYVARVSGYKYLKGVKAANDYGSPASVVSMAYMCTGDPVAYTGSGIFDVVGEEVLTDPSTVCVDVTALSGSGLTYDAVNPNCLFIANAGQLTNTKNVIVNGVCDNLVLTDGYPFKAPDDFTATAASYTTTINASAGAGTLCLPFAATIPGGVEAWTLTYTSGDAAVVATPVSTTTISANTPVLLNGSGEKTFTGASAAVSASATNKAGALTGVFAAATVPVNSYVLQKQDAKVGFFKVTGDKTINPFRAYLTAETPAPSLRIIFPEDNDVTGISEIEKMKNADNVTIFDLQGRKVAQPQKGLYIVNGKKVIFK